MKWFWPKSNLGTRLKVPFPRKSVDTDTQFQPIRSGKKCDVVIGLDFGTSCTKVIIRTPYHYSGSAYAIPFGKVAHPSNPYLLPSVLTVDEKGQCSLGTGHNGHAYRNIKYYLVKDDPVPSVNNPSKGLVADTLAISFLSLCLRAARFWFLKNQAGLYKQYDLTWHFNLGLPSADYADDTLSETYQHISEAAWKLSTHKADVTLKSAEAARFEINSNNDDIPAEIHVVPEVAAEVVGYARSHLRNEGLHILMDIGAGTLDVCGFILHASQGDDCYELLTADVQQLGTIALHESRIHGVDQATQSHLSALRNSCDPIKPVPESHEEYLPVSALLSNEIERSSQAYVSECKKMLWKTILDLKRTRDPRSARWRDGLPVFICGGASSVKLYQDMIDATSSEMKGLYKCGGISKCTLPKPKQLSADIAENDYHRLGVAWGLSYPEVDIGNVRRPIDIPDIAPRKTTGHPDVPWER